MTRTIRLPIIDHATRCLDDEGQPCPHMRMTHFGTLWICQAFDSREVRDADGGVTGVLLRLPECIAAEAVS